MLKFMYSCIILCTLTNELFYFLFILLLNTWMYVVPGMSDICESNQINCLVCYFTEQKHVSVCGIHKSH